MGSKNGVLLTCENETYGIQDWLLNVLEWTGDVVAKFHVVHDDPS